MLTDRSELCQEKTGHYAVAVQIMAKVKPRSDWSQLPTDVWATILMLAQQQTVSKLQMSEHKSLQASSDVKQFALQQQQQQRWVFGLRMVCRRVEAALAHQPDHGGALALVNLSEAVLPSLLAWLSKHHATVRKVLTGCDASSLKVALHALHTYLACPLEVCIISRCIPATVPSLLVYKSLASCELYCSAWHRVDLEGLRLLPRLTRLDLFGSHFDNASAAEHLTSLHVVHASADFNEACRCVTSLKSICTSYGYAFGFQLPGLSACSGLQSLACIQGSIGNYDNKSAGMHFYDFYRDAGWFVPYSISHLTALTCLKVAAFAIDDYDTLSWLTHLTALQDLTVAFRSKVVTLPPEVSSLSNLKQVCLGDRLGSAEYVLQLDWTKLLLLESASFHGIVIFSQSLDTFASMPFLRELNFMECKNSVQEPDPTDYLVKVAALKAQLGHERPDIKVHIT